MIPNKQLYKKLNIKKLNIYKKKHFVKQIVGLLRMVEELLKEVNFPQ